MVASRPSGRPAIDQVRCPGDCGVTLVLNWDVVPPSSAHLDGKNSEFGEALHSSSDGCSVLRVAVSRTDIDDVRIIEWLLNDGKTTSRSWDPPPAESS